jgi:hypothetical protein
MNEARQHTSRAKRDASANEVYGPHLPPGSMMRNGRFVPIPPVAKDGATTKRQADEANRRLVPASLLKTDRWCNVGGSGPWRAFYGDNSRWEV